MISLQIKEVGGRVVLALRKKGLAIVDIALLTSWQVKRVSSVVHNANGTRFPRPSFHSAEFYRKRGEPPPVDLEGKEIKQILKPLLDVEALPRPKPKSKPVYRPDCIICGNKIPQRKKARGRPRFLCEKRFCHKQQSRKKEEMLLDAVLNPENLHGWYRKLHEELARHPIGQNEQWLRSSKASVVSGVKPNLLAYLARRKLVQTREDSRKKVHKVPVRLFSKSQMEILRQVYHRHMVQN